MLTVVKMAIILLKCKCEVESLIQVFHAYCATDNISSLQPSSQLWFFACVAPVGSVKRQSVPAPMAQGSFDSLRWSRVEADTSLVADRGHP